MNNPQTFTLKWNHEQPDKCYLAGCQGQTSGSARFFQEVNQRLPICSEHHKMFTHIDEAFKHGHACGHAEYEDKQRKISERKLWFRVKRFFRCLIN